MDMRAMKNLVNALPQYRRDFATLMRNAFALEV